MSLGAGAERHRIFLHVGSPKTGTTFLQQVLWSQRRTAKRQGLLLPLSSFFEHYLASLDVRGLAARPEHPPLAVGIFAKAAREADAWPGDVLISHELFASATAEQAERAIAAFAGDAEVHVVLTARDLVRQIPAEWQEHLKHRSRKTSEAFLRDLEVDTDGSSWFWRVQDFADVTERWGRGLPPERVHVVTVPPAGADPDILWTRFATLLGLDPDTFDTKLSRSNTSLGAEQAELLRRVNAALGKRLPLPGPYAADVKNMFAQRVLARQPGTKLALDADGVDFAIRRSQEIVAALETQQVHVVGDLTELVPGPISTGTGPISTGTSPISTGTRPISTAAVGDDVLLAESITALVGLLEEHRARRTERDAARRQLERPIRFLLARASERHPALMHVRKLYWRFHALTSRLRRQPKT